MNESTPNDPKPAQTPAASAPPPAGTDAANAPASALIAVTRQIFVTHLEIKTPDGQSYLEGGARKLVKADSEPLAQFLADAEINRGGGPQKRDVILNYFFGAIPTSQWRPMKLSRPACSKLSKRPLTNSIVARTPAKTSLNFSGRLASAFACPIPILNPIRIGSSATVLIPNSSSCGVVKSWMAIRGPLHRCRSSKIKNFFRTIRRQSLISSARDC